MPVRVYLVHFLTGVALGAALMGSEVYHPRVIKSSFNTGGPGQDLSLFRTFIASSALSALFIFNVNNSRAFWDIHLEPRSASNYGWFRYDGNVVGGLLQGMGMILCAADPGTMLLQTAMGLKSALWATIGGVVGGWMFVAFGEKLKRESVASTERQLEKLKRTEPATIQSTLNISPWSALLLYESILMVLLYCIDQLDATPASRTTRRLISSLMSGLPLFFAQLLSILYAKKTVGVSSAFPDLARYITSTISRTRGTTSTQSFPMSVVFALGIATALPLAVIAVQSGSVSSLPYALALLATMHLPDCPTNTSAMLGGVLLIFGARLSGGCSSGHGLSGTSLMSVSSFITVVFMVVGGFATSWLQDLMLSRF